MSHRSHPSATPVPRAKRPMRRDLGGYTYPADGAVWREAATKILEQYGFPRESISDSASGRITSLGHDEILGEIHDALSFRAHQPPCLLRVSDENADLRELLVRLEDVADALAAMHPRTCSLIFEAVRSAGLELNPYDVETQVRTLKSSVAKALDDLPSDEPARGRKPYDDSRETPLLATLMAAWFGQYPNDEGVKRHGDYAETGKQEYDGRLLNFLTAMFESIGIDAGTPTAIGRRLFQKPEAADIRTGSRSSLQDRIRAKFRREVSNGA